jgi:prepilin-type processing-associated H-X9-DG protein
VETKVNRGMTRNRRHMGNTIVSLESDGTSSTLDRPALNKPSDAFTLIELLVSGEVIGILASFLMPALSSVKRRADSTRCISNLHQLGIATGLYADEYEGHMPSARAFGQPGIKVARELPVIQEVLSSHVSAVTNVFKCPADKGGVFEREGCSYEWNVSLNGRILFRIGRDRPDENTTRTFLLRDREGWHFRGRTNAVFADGHVGLDGL